MVKRIKLTLGGDILRWGVFALANPDARRPISIALSPPARISMINGDVKYRGRAPAFMTHPLDRKTGCSLTKSVKVPAKGRTALQLQVANDNRGDFLLAVKADGKTLL